MNNFIDYRCLEPSATTVGEPWFRIPESCPCNPLLSNPTGRGFTACPFGVQFDIPSSSSEPLMTLAKEPTKKDDSVPKFRGQQINTKGFMAGSMFPELSSAAKFTPPQLQPRQIVRIGQTFRS